MLEAAAWGEAGDGLSGLALEARDGSEEAIGQLWATVRPRLIRIALALGIRPDDVPDLVQDVLLAAYARLHEFEPARGRFEGWLATMLVRRARNHRRGLLRRLRFLAGLDRQPPRSGMDAVDARLTLKRLLAVLTPVQQEVVAVYEIGEAAADDAARTLGMTAAGVRSIARDARRKLAAAAREAGR